MSATLISAMAAVVALVLIYGLWIGIHLLARYRMGVRQIGCRGPVTDDFGNEVCCHTGEPCTKDEACESDLDSSSPTTR